MPDKKWDGQIERRKYPSDHDSLIQVITLLAEHVKNFDQHVRDDKDNFKNLGDRLWTHAKYIYMGIGICAVVEVIVGLHK